MYKNIASLLAAAKERGVALHEIVMESEMNLTGKSAADIRASLLQRWQVMRQSAHRALDAPQDMFGGLIRGLAYPFGTYSDTVVEALKATGVAYARTVVSTNDFSIPNDWLRLHPTCHHAAPNLDQLCDRFLQDSAPFGSRLFYLWGHSYEFEAMDNWDVIERFCEKMGGRDDIWYATNIEIVDYVNACRAIRTSANGKRMHNPTAIDVWADVNGKQVVICAGETVEV